MILLHDNAPQISPYLLSCFNKLKMKNPSKTEEILSLLYTEKDKFLWIKDLKLDGTFPSTIDYAI